MEQSVPKGQGLQLLTSSGHSPWSIGQHHFSSLPASKTEGPGENEQMTFLTMLPIKLGERSCRWIKGEMSLFGVYPDCSEFSCSLLHVLGGTGLLQYSSQYSEPVYNGKWDENEILFFIHLWISDETMTMKHNVLKVDKGRILQLCLKKKKFQPKQRIRTVSNRDLRKSQTWTLCCCLFRWIKRRAK